MIDVGFIFFCSASDAASGFFRPIKFLFLQVFLLFKFNVSCFYVICSVEVSCFFSKEGVNYLSIYQSFCFITGSSWT